MPYVKNPTIGAFFTPIFEIKLGADNDA